MKQQTNPKSKTKKRLIITGGIFIALITLFFIFVVINVSGSTKSIKSAADQFRAPMTWQKEYEHIEPPRFICLEGACPELTRTWRVDTLSYQEFSTLLHGTKWKFILNKECEKLNQSTQDSPPDLICNVNATFEKFEMYMSIERLSKGSNNLKVYLSTRPL